MQKTINILFVCLGNICRSPAGEAVLKHLAQQDSSLKLHVESCGIGDWHIGQAPDHRIQEAARARGIVMTSRAQQFQQEFLDKFDYILVSDKEVLKVLYQYARTPEQKAKISLMTKFSFQHQDQEVPDPYYEPDTAFDLVLDMLEDSCQGLLDHLKQFQ